MLTELKKNNKTGALDLVIQVPRFVFNGEDQICTFFLKFCLISYVKFLWIVLIFPNEIRSTTRNFCELFGFFVQYFFRTFYFPATAWGSAYFSYFFFIFFLIFIFAYNHPPAIFMRWIFPLVMVLVFLL